MNPAESKVGLVVYDVIRHFTEKEEDDELTEDQKAAIRHKVNRLQNNEDLEV
jgi:hypothetical protein